MSEIRSIRVRNIQNTDGSLDNKVTLIKKIGNNYIVSWRPTGGNITTFEYNLLAYNQEKKDYFESKIKSNSLDLNDPSIIKGFNKNYYTDADVLLNDAILQKQKIDSTNYEIVQDPWLDSAPIYRNFGIDPYYLNDGSIIYINWSDNKGKSWSDDNGDELNIQKGASISTKAQITKTIKILAPSSYIGTNDIITINKSGIIDKYTSTNSQNFIGTKLDIDIIQQFIFSCKSKIPNYYLEICEPNNTLTLEIEYMNPLDELTNMEDNSLDNKTPEQSKTNRQKLSIVLPSDLNIKVKESISSMKIYVGNPPVDAGREGFDYGDEFDDSSLLDAEYTENTYAGQDESDQVITDILTKDLTSDIPTDGIIDDSKASSASALSGRVAVVVGGKSMNPTSSNPMEDPATKADTAHWTHRKGGCLVGDSPSVGSKKIINRDGNQYGYVKNEGGRYVSYANSAGWLGWYSGYIATNGKSVSDNSKSKEYYIAYDVSISVNGKTQPIEIHAPFDCKVVGVQPHWGDVGLVGIGADKGKTANFTHCTGPSYNTNNTNIHTSNGMNSGFASNMNAAIKQGMEFKKGQRMNIFQGNVAPPGASQGVHIHIDLMSKRDFDQYIKDILSENWYDNLV